MFDRFQNGSGMLSLSACELGVRDQLRLPQVYSRKAVIAKAFAASRNADGYVTRSEFRWFLVRLRQYWALHCIYSKLLSRGQCTLANFVSILPLLEAKGYHCQDAETAFNNICVDGFIKYDTFVTWAVVDALKNGMDEMILISRLSLYDNAPSSCLLMTFSVAFRGPTSSTSCPVRVAEVALHATESI